jgi:hypothetical protein
MEVILSFLTPLMLAGGITDTTIGRLAAQEAIEASKTGSLLTIAQVVAFAMTSLDNLRLSAPADLSLTLKLRLRGNANALNQSTQRTAATLDPQPAKPAPAKPQPAKSHPTEPAPPLDPAADRRRQLDWADAMTDVAAECARKLGKLPSAKRHAEMIRISVLRTTAQKIRRGGPTASQVAASQAAASQAAASPQTGDHPAQQPVPQDDLMVERPQDVQPGGTQQHPGEDLVNIPHLPPER